MSKVTKIGLENTAIVLGGTVLLIVAAALVACLIGCQPQTIVVEKPIAVINQADTPDIENIGDGWMRVYRVVDHAYGNICYVYSNSMVSQGGISCVKMER